MRRRLLAGAVGVVLVGGFALARWVTPSFRPLLGPLVAAQQPTCLVHGRALVWTSLTPVDDAVVCFEGGRLTVVGWGAVPNNAKVIDVKGSTVLPGLVDTHVHVTATEAPPWRFKVPQPQHNLEAYLYSGITTVFDMGGVTAELHALQQELADGRRVGPQLFHAHPPFTVPGGHPIPALKALLPWPLGAAVAGKVPVVVTSADAAPMVEAAKREGAQFVKVIHDALPPGAPQFDLARLKAVVAAAHAQGLKVVAHIGSNQDAIEAATAGVDHLAHGVYRDAVTREVVTALREHNVSVTVTAAGFDNTRQLANGAYAPDAWARETSDPALLEAVTGAAGTEFGRTPVLGDFARGIVDRAQLRANVKRLHEGGVLVLVGTDSPIAAVFPGASYFEELALLREAGLSNQELLERATTQGARLLNRKPDFGSLVVGMRADVIVVGADPTDDVMALRQLQYVFANGREVPRLPPPPAR